MGTMVAERQPMQHVRWVQPALLWEGQPFQDLEDHPVEVLEIASDNFLPEFLDAMQSSLVPQPDGALVPDAAARYLRDHRLPGAEHPVKLFQPIHGRYYLVTASLVCKTAGLPDKTVERPQGQQVAFVVRRPRADGSEEYWSRANGWTALTDCCAPADEERFPMQPVQVATGHPPDHPLFPARRTVYVGYVVTGSREKYESHPPAAARFLADETLPPAQRLNQYLALAQENGAAFNAHAHEFQTRVLESWRMLIEKGSAITAPAPVSVGIVIDLGDFLARALPDVWTAIKANSAPNSTTRPKQRALYNALNLIAFPTAAGTRLLAALRAQAVSIDGGAARGEIDLPNAAYDLRTALRLTVDSNGVITGTTPITAAALTPGGFLDVLIGEALAEDAAARGGKPHFTDAQAGSMLALIKGLVRPTVTHNNQPVIPHYVIRLVYDYEPGCPPVVSRPSRPFELAKSFDPDAPPRLVRLEMPSIRPRDLRKYAHGVGIQMSSDLRQVMAGVHTGMLDGDPLKSSPSVSLDMICTFSIPIITLVALIVMFVFLILFNIIFWWMAFLRICLPVPKFEE